MKYLSTRGGMAAMSFSQVLLEGLAPDGGLAVPEQYPQVDAATLERWRALDYPALAFEVLRLFATDIPEADLRALCERSYTAEAFGKPFVPLKPINDGLQLLGLSEGPTLAFKDMAMQFLGHLFEYELARRNETVTILGATSGDTGSAAEYALRGKRGVQVVMLSPHGRMSAFQRAQMFSLPDANIHNLAVRGVFDDCQDIVKAVSGDLAFKSRYRIGAVNSINWARIAAQVVYYVHGWLRASRGPGEPVSFTVPSGNFGNILAGHIARRMGVPIRHLVLATNENNVLEECFRTGIYRPRRGSETWQTSSPSMDISKASNFERYVFDLMGRDPKALAAAWADMERTGQLDLTPFRQAMDESGFRAGASSHAARLDTIRRVHAACGYVLDPHTADGVQVARQFVEPGVPMLVLETALPAKFAETIVEAIGLQPPRPVRVAGIEDLPQRVEVIDADVERVKQIIRGIYGD